jgi:hypothetical protein
VTHVDYTPGVSLVVRATAGVDGLRRSAVIRAGAAVTDVVRATGTPLPGSGAVLHWFPSDPALPLLGASTRALHALLGDRDTGPAHSGLADGRPTVLAYVPGRRATLGVAPYVVKTYASVDAFRRARAAMELLGDDTRLPTPGVVKALPRHRATVQHHVPSTPLARRQALLVSAHAGRLLHGLHGSNRRAIARRDPAMQLLAAREAVDVVSAVLPDQAARARRLLARLVETAPTGLPMVLSHGDFSVDQFLMTTEGDLVVADVDNACQAPAALDIARFAANLVSGRAGDGDHARSVLDALASGYGSAPPGLDWHFAVALLRRADRPFRRLKKTWPDKVSAILGLASDAAPPG